MPLPCCLEHLLGEAGAGVAGLPPCSLQFLELEKLDLQEQYPDGLCLQQLSGLGRVVSW